MADTEVFLVVEEVVLQTLFVIDLVVRYIRRNERRRVTQHVNAIRYVMSERIPDQVSHMRRLVEISDTSCIDNLRMNRNAFARLCYLLEHVGGVVESRYVSIYEKVAMFLAVLAHHKKNRIVKHDFIRSGQTISKHFQVVLNAVLKLYPILLVEPQPVPDNCTNNTWKWFKGCLGALDGTYIPVKVPAIDKPRYRSRKGDITVNVLGVCDRNQKFIYLLPGWEGSAADARVLRDAVNRPHGLRVPTDLNARLMRFKSWPYYEDWIEIFGKDRATGIGAEDFTEAVNEVIHSEKRKEKETGDNYEGLFDGFADETDPNSPSQQSSGTTKKSVKKRKLIDPNDPLVNILGTFCDKAEARLGDIASRIGYEFDASKARKGIFNAVASISGLSIEEALTAADLIATSKEKLDVFFSLPDEMSID